MCYGNNQSINHSYHLCVLSSSSEQHELFLHIAFNSLSLKSDHIEPDSLRERSALANSDYVSFSESREGRRGMDRDVGVSLLETIVLLDVVEVVSPDDYGLLHLG